MSEPVEVPEAPESLVDVGKACDNCGRNMGMFPVSEVCQYCRPVVTDFGVIEAVEYSPVCSSEIERIPNSSISLDEDGNVTFLKGTHKDSVFLDDGPSITEGRNPATVMILEEAFPPASYTIYLR